MIGGRDDRRHGLSGTRPLTAVRREVRALLEYARALEKLSEQQYQTRLGRLRRARSMAEAKHCANGLPHPDFLSAPDDEPVTEAGRAYVRALADAEDRSGWFTRAIANAEAASDLRAVLTGLVPAWSRTGCPARPPTRT
jgi:hypothetical protein